MHKLLISRIVNWAVLPIGALLIGLLLAEAFLRLANISYPVFDTYDDLRGVALKAGKEGWYRREGEAYLRINSLGYRDSEHTLAKPAGTFRIAVLGDSFAEARQVDQDATFWSLLGQELSRCPDLRGSKLEVLNFGIGGYGTAQELLTLRKDALRFSPDLVLLAFFAENDLRDNSKTLSYREGWRMPVPYFTYSDGTLQLDDSFRQARGHRLVYDAIHHLRVMEVFNEARRSLIARKSVASRPDTSAALYADPVDPDWREAWQITEALLARIHREVRATGARFVVTTISMPRQVHPDPELRASIERRLGVTDLFYPDRRIAEIGHRHGFQVIGLAEPLQWIATRTRTYLHGFRNSTLGEGHLNEAGHRWSAEILANELCSGTLAPVSPLLDALRTGGAGDITS